jgi:hypothetical protein
MVAGETPAFLEKTLLLPFSNYSVAVGNRPPGGFKQYGVLADLSLLTAGN